jgi:hypothetical protein
MCERCPAATDGSTRDESTEPAFSSYDTTAHQRNHLSSRLVYDTGLLGVFESAGVFK